MYNMRIILKFRLALVKIFMNGEKNIYKTYQREILIGFLRSRADTEFSAEEITQALCGKEIGKSTIYRLLSGLCRTGEIVRTSGNGKKVFYRYIDRTRKCDAHFHLKCNRCGRIIHLECELMEELAAHIAGEHGFRPDPGTTIISGICCECEKKENEK